MGDGQPKYLNTAETAIFHEKRNLYGFNWAKQHIVSDARAVVVEGYTDAIACYEAGIGNVVATLGTALTEQHVKTLTRFSKQIIYLFDGDAAGQKAAERAIQFIEQSSVDLRCVVLPDNMDPMEFLSARGGDALRALLDDAEPLMDFVFGKLAERSDASTPAGRTKALDEACRLIYPLRASYLIDSYYMQIATGCAWMWIRCARLLRRSSVPCAPKSRPLDAASRRANPPVLLLRGIVRLPPRQGELGGALAPRGRCQPFATAAKTSMCRMTTYRLMPTRA